jgi:hypothetical protein
MKKKTASDKISVQGTEVTVIHREGQDSISLADMLKAKPGDFSTFLATATGNSACPKISASLMRKFTLARSTREQWRTLIIGRQKLPCPTIPDQGRHASTALELPCAAATLRTRCVSFPPAPPLCPPPAWLLRKNGPPEVPGPPCRGHLNRPARPASHQERLQSSLQITAKQVCAQPRIALPAFFASVTSLLSNSPTAGSCSFQWGRAHKGRGKVESRRRLNSIGFSSMGPHHRAEVDCHFFYPCLQPDDRHALHQAIDLPPEASPFPWQVEMFRVIPMLTNP